MVSNYREVHLNINGQEFDVGGFRRPEGVSTFLDLKQKGVDAVISLDGTHTSSY